MLILYHGRVMHEREEALLQDGMNSIDSMLGVWYNGATPPRSGCKAQRGVFIGSVL